MNTKLTLRLDDELIESAKQYAAKSGKSVSKLVGDFFALIRKEKLTTNYTVTPTVKSLRGILKDSKLDEPDFKAHLTKKYL